MGLMGRLQAISEVSSVEIGSSSLQDSEPAQAQSFSTLPSPTPSPNSFFTFLWLIHTPLSPHLPPAMPPSTDLSFPYIARSIKKYRSPHVQDLSFPKGAVIRVTGLAPKTAKDEDDDDDDDDEDDDDVWLLGELKDGTAQGTFPGACVEPSDDLDDDAPPPATPTAATEINSSAATSSIEAPTSKEEIVEPAKTGLIPTESSSTSAVTEAHPGSLAKDTGEAATAPTPAVEQATQTSNKEAAAPNESLASPSSPTKTAAPGPPPPKPKPSGLAARIAAFNQPASGSSPPPLPKSKPAGVAGGWKRPTPQEGDKPVLPGAPTAAKPSPAASQPRAPPAVGDSTSEAKEASPAPSEAGSGFSAADAASSIKMSLKERMAALQRGGDSSGGSAEAATSKSPPPLVAKPGRLTADRRAVALAAMGTSPSGQSSESLTLADDGKTAPTGVSEDGGEGTLTSQADAEPVDKEVSAETDSLKQETVEPAGEEGAASPEDDEAQRRAAIAQRLARLGGQRVGGPGPAVFGAPRPIPEKKPSQSEEAIKSPVDSEAAADAPIPEDQVEEKPKTLDVPRRTAPPRRKRSAPSPAQEIPADSSAASAVTNSTEATEPASSDVVSAQESQPASVSAQDQPDISETTSRSAVPDSADGEDTLVTGPPPPENVVDPGSIAQNLQETEESPGPMEDVHEQARDEREAEQVQKTIADLPGEDDDEELKRKAAALDAFLSRDEDSGEELDDNDDGESHTIPSALRAQLGLDSRQSSLASGPASADLAHGQEDDEDPTLDASSAQMRSMSPAPLPPSTSSSRPPIPSSRPESRASLTAPNRAAPTPPPQSGMVGDPGRRGSTSSRPPIPRSPPPRAPSASIAGTLAQAEEKEEPQTEEESFMGASEQAAAVAGLPSANAPQLAAPTARRAVPVDDEEDDDAEPMQAASSEEAPATVEPTQLDEEPSELTEEQEEAARRARIAKRMAALGGQRMGGMPIMGAPMPSRQRSVETRSEEAVESEVQQLSGNRVPRGGMAIPGMTQPLSQRQEVEEPAQEEDRDEEAEPEPSLPPRSMASPPPVPTGAGNRSSFINKPMSPPPGPPSAAAGQDGLSRSSSIRPPIPSGAAPPVPGGSHQRQGSIDQALAGMTIHQPEDLDDVEDAEEDDVDEDYERTTEQPQRAVSPPVLPSSPPPRAPSRPPPPPAGFAAPSSPPGADQPDRRPSVVSMSGSVSSLGQQMPRSGSRTSYAGPPKSSSSSPRDFDLMPSTRWWRSLQAQGPAALPPSITSRPDLIYSINQGNQEATIKVLFDDYSLTVVRVAWSDDDEDESSTQLEQHHELSPGAASQDQLQRWSSTVGVDLAQQALLLLSSSGGKSASTPGYPNSHALVHSLFSASRASPLPPVASTFGPTVLSQVGPTVLDRPGEPKAGDVVLFQAADFKGKKGLGSYHLTLGGASRQSQSQSVPPQVGIVVEVQDGKKRKYRVATVASSGGPVEEVAIKMEDLKSGVVKVMRVAKRGEWTSF